MDAEQRIREAREFDRYLRTPDYESRDLGTGTGPGYLIPPSLMPGILFGVRYASAFLANLRLWNSVNPVTGAPYGGAATYPVIAGDISSLAQDYNDLTQASFNDPTLTRVTFAQAPEQILELFKLSLQLMEDSNVPVADLLRNAIAQRVSRTMDALAVTNLLAAATLNLTTATSATVVYADIVNWIEKLADLSLMGSPTSVIVVSPTTLAKLRLMADTNLRPIIDTDDFTVSQDNAAAMFGGDDSYSRTIRVNTLMGIPCLTSNALPAFAAGSIVGIAGDLQQAGIYRHVEMSVQPLFERYADSLAVGYLGFYRGDIQVSNANAFATLTIHA